MSLFIGTMELVQYEQKKKTERKRNNNLVHHIKYAESERAQQNHFSSY